MSYRDAVVRLADGAPDVPWAVTASANLALRGLDVDPGDVDVMTTAEGTYALEDAFSDAVVRPVRPPADRPDKRIRSHYGALSLSGVEVELMGDVEHRVDGAWVPADDVADERESVTVEGREVPVMSLDHELRGYRAMGRDERVHLLERAGVEA